MPRSPRRAPGVAFPVDELHGAEDLAVGRQQGHGQHAHGAVPGPEVEGVVEDDRRVRTEPLDVRQVQRAAVLHHVADDAGGVDGDEPRRQVARAQGVVLGHAKTQGLPARAHVLDHVERAGVRAGQVAHRLEHPGQQAVRIALGVQAGGDLEHVVDLEAQAVGARVRRAGVRCAGARPGERERQLPGIGVRHAQPVVSRRPACREGVDRGGGARPAQEAERGRGLAAKLRLLRRGGARGTRG